MIRSLRNFFSRRSTGNLPNNSTITALANPNVLSAVRAETETREDRSNRPRTRRETPSRRGLVKQPVRITVTNGNVVVDPVERDLYDGEQVEWICTESAWETRFDVADSNTPFDSDVFGPGLLSAVALPESASDLPQIDEVSDLSGSIRDEVLTGDYSYSVQVDGFGPLQARVKVIRGNRPR